MNITINADTVSIVVTVISFFSMLIAVVGAIISERNLRLQRKIYNESIPSFKVKEVLDSYMICEESRGIIKLMFYPLIVNTSSKTLILEKIRLHLIGEDNAFILRPIVDEKYINDGYSILGSNADTKWICFEIQLNVYESLKILRHDLVFEDAYQNTQTISVIRLKELLKGDKTNEERS